MDPHPLANLFKLVSYRKPVANNEEDIQVNAIGIHLLNQKHDCNDVNMNSMKVNCATDHDWGDDVSFDLENLFKPHNESTIDNEIFNSIESGFGRVSTLGKNNHTYL
jgi:hypothetical protein